MSRFSLMHSIRSGLCRAPDHQPLTSRSFVEIGRCPKSITSEGVDVLPTWRLSRWKQYVREIAITLLQMSGNDPLGAELPHELHEHLFAVDHVVEAEAARFGNVRHDIPVAAENVIGKG